MGLVILSACRSSHLEADSCLADVEANALDGLQRCNRVVKAPPRIRGPTTIASCCTPCCRTRKPPAKTSPKPRLCSSQRSEATTTCAPKFWCGR